MQKTPVEVIVDDKPNSGLFNMAMDEALLNLAVHRNFSVVRIYRWSEPTITLGYFQGSAIDTIPQFTGLPSVRRLSGGGAILHDRELTYSCILPASHETRSDPSLLYRLIHQNLIVMLRRCGVPCELRDDWLARTTFHQVAKSYDFHAGVKSPSDATLHSPTTPDQPSNEQRSREVTRPEPFLCFLRSNPNDIVHDSGVKIVGSAQRRRRGTTLQHGSLILDASDHAMDIPGIRQLAGNVDLAEIHRRIPTVIADSVGSDVRFRGYTDEELEAVRQLRQRN